MIPQSGLILIGPQGGTESNERLDHTLQRPPVVVLQLYLLDLEEEDRAECGVILQKVRILHYIAEKVIDFLPGATMARIKGVEHRAFHTVQNLEHILAL